MQALKPPDLLTVEVDIQEKLKVGFPESITWSDLSRGIRDHVIEVRKEELELPTADFRLRGFGDITLVERKNSIKEIHKNVNTADRHRQSRCFNRLSTECLFPILWYEGDLCELEGQYVPDGEGAFNRLHQMLIRRGVTLLCATVKPARRSKFGGLLTALMWNIVWEELNRREDSARAKALVS